MKKKEIVILILIIAIFSLSVVSMNRIQHEVATNADIKSSKTIGWGIKRAENNLQPDVGAENKRILEENGGICLGNELDKVIYLTFDEGYEAGYTECILNTLKENEVKATFFITSHYLNTASELVERMINEGHIVGNQFPTTVKDRIEK